MCVLAVFGQKAYTPHGISSAQSAFVGRTTWLAVAHAMDNGLVCASLCNSLCLAWSHFPSSKPSLGTHPQHPLATPQAHPRSSPHTARGRTQTHTCVRASSRLCAPTYTRTNACTCAHHIYTRRERPLMFLGRLRERGLDITSTHQAGPLPRTHQRSTSRHLPHVKPRVRPL